MDWTSGGLLGAASLRPEEGGRVCSVGEGSWLGPSLQLFPEGSLKVNLLLKVHFKKGGVYTAGLPSCCHWLLSEIAKCPKTSVQIGKIAYLQLP